MTVCRVDWIEVLPHRGRARAPVQLGVDPGSGWGHPQRELSRPPRDGLGLELRRRRASRVTTYLYIRRKLFRVLQCVEVPVAAVRRCGALEGAGGQGPAARRRSREGEDETPVLAGGSPATSDLRERADVGVQLEAGRDGGGEEPRERLEQIV
jgi:hypothetical protein